METIAVAKTAGVAVGTQARLDLVRAKSQQAVALAGLKRATACR